MRSLGTSGKIQYQLDNRVLWYENRPLGFSVSDHQTSTSADQQQTLHGFYGYLIGPDLGVATPSLALDKVKFDNFPAFSKLVTTRKFRTDYDIYHREKNPTSTGHSCVKGQGLPRSLASSCN